jgi:hypothetical protein
MYGSCDHGVRTSAPNGHRRAVIVNRPALIVGHVGRVERTRWSVLQNMIILITSTFRVKAAVFT